MAYMIDNSVFKTKKFLQFDKYILRNLSMSGKEKLRLYHSRSEDTVKSYVKVIKKFVNYSAGEPFPVTETSVRQFVNSLSIEDDKTTLTLLKPSFVV